MDNGLMVRYIGPGVSDYQAECVTTDNPIPRDAPLYYFEIDIIDKGAYGFIGIGIIEEGCRLNILPGWASVSFGYHGDDGYRLLGNGIGSHYGPTFTSGDTIGCCVNFLSNQVFFTKNGINLGIATENFLQGNIYPVVGMRSRGECIEANFGGRPFKFNIDMYIQASCTKHPIIKGIQDTRDDRVVEEVVSYIVDP